MAICHLPALLLVAYRRTGSSLGPLLFLMYINDLANCLRDAAPRMFADDTNITLSAKTIADLKLRVTSELNNLTCWVRASRLSLNVAKTELMITGSRQRLNAQCEEIEISIDDRTIKRVDHTKSLGLTTDAQLSWSKHVDEIERYRMIFASICEHASSAFIFVSTSSDPIYFAISEHFRKYRW